MHFMKYKKTIMIAMAIISITTLLGSSSTLFADETITPPIPTTVLDYKDMEYYIFTNPTEVNLTHIHSETTPDALTITKTDYYPSTNETKYRFQSNEFLIPTDFNPGIKTYTYQDTNTGQLYTIQIDLTNVVVPLSQLEQDYQNLQQNYTLLLEDYNTLNTTKNQLQENITTIQNILSQEYNLSNQNITSITETLLTNYIETNNTLNTTQQQLQDLQLILEDKNNTLQDAQHDYNILLSNYSNLLADYHELNNTLNTTQNTLMNKSIQLSQLERFKQDIDYGTNTFQFDGRLYRSQQSYENEIQQLKDDLGLTPSYIIIAIIITFLCVFYLAKNYYEKQQPTPQELQEYGYSPKAQQYDNFIIRTIMEKAGEITGRFKNKKPKTKTKPQPGPQPTPITEPTPQKTDETGLIGEKIDTLIHQQTQQTDTVNHYMKKTDDRIDTIETNVETIGEKIDNLQPKTDDKKQGKNNK